MADFEKLVKGSLVKASGAIQISSDNVSLLQRKCFNILLVNAYNDLAKKETYRIAVNDIRNALSYHDTSELKISLKSLAKIVIEMNYLGDRDKSEWEITTLLADARIRDNDLFYSYGPLFREKLQNTAFYARIDMAIQKKFKTKYALSLYEICCDHFIRKTGHGQTPFIELDDLRRLLGCVEDTAYNNFKALKQWVIKKAITEITEKTDLLIETKVKRARRKVIAVQFLITINPDKGKIIEELFPDPVVIPPIALDPALPLPLPVLEKSDLHKRLVAEFDLNNQ